MAQEMSSSIHGSNVLLPIPDPSEHTQVAPLRVTHTTLALPTFVGQTRGVYIVECMGEGIACRALVRVGHLNCTDTADERGHVFCVYDETLSLLRNVTVMVGGAAYKCNGKMLLGSSTSANAGKQRSATRMSNYIIWKV